MKFVNQFNIARTKKHVLFSGLVFFFGGGINVLFKVWGGPLVI